MFQLPIFQIFNHGKHSVYPLRVIDLGESDLAVEVKSVVIGQIYQVNNFSAKEANPIKTVFKLVNNWKG